MSDEELNELADLLRNLLTKPLHSYERNGVEFDLDLVEEELAERASVPGGRL